MGDAEPHHDVLQVQHVLVPLLSAGAAQGAGPQHMVSSDVPARDGTRRQDGDRVLLAPRHGHPVRFGPGLLLLHSKNYLTCHCDSQCLSMGIC